MKKVTSLLKACTGLFCVMASGQAAAQSGEPHLLGDWGGLHSALEAHGLDLQANYVNEVSSNVSGGAEHDTVYADQFYLGGALHFDQWLGTTGSKLVFSLSNRNGESLSQRAGLNTLYLVDEVWGQGSYTRVNQLYLEQSLFDSRVDVKLGRMTGSGEFMAFSCEFQNQTFCGTLAAYMVPNWVPFPGSTWAGTVRLNLNGGFYLEGGAYEVNPNFQQHKYTTAFGKPFDGIGERYLFEAGWTRGADAYPGTYRLGAWYDDAGAADLYVNTDFQPLVSAGGTPLQRDHHSGFYATAQQRLWTNTTGAAGSVDVFANLVQGDADVSLKEQLLEIGVFWKAPLSIRPQDDVGVAIGRVGVSDRVAAGEQLFNATVAPALGVAPVAVQHAEYPAEIYYSLNIHPGATFRPNVQVIQAPGGVGSRTTVVVFGLKTIINF